MSQQPPSLRQKTSQIIQRIQSDWLDYFFVPLLLAIGIGFTLWLILNGDWLMAGISGGGSLLLFILTTVTPVQKRLLKAEFNRHHAFYVAVFWVYSLLWLWVYRQLNAATPVGKDSTTFYIFLILFFAITFRALVTLFALTPRGYRLLISTIPLWEKILVALNEFVAAGILAAIVGGNLARWLQPSVFTVRVDPAYSLLVTFCLLLYYIATQVMWIQWWNRFLSRNMVWVYLARPISLIALTTVTIVIVRHFSRLSDPRTANLLGSANVDQTVLALSPVVWMMALFLCLIVWSGRQGLRRLFLPDLLLQHLPPRLSSFLATISDMDILMIFGGLATFIPLNLALFDDSAIGIIDRLRLQISQDNALIDSSEQALAFLFAMPFYGLAVVTLVLYAYVLSRRNLPAKTRDDLVDRLPIGSLIVFIITLYLCAIPFSQVLVEGRLPQLPQELGRVLAFDVLIPLILLYAHYFVLVRIPYGQGQSGWRAQRSTQLELELQRIDQQIRQLQTRIQQGERIWQNRHNLRATSDQHLDMLYHFVEMNGERDRLSMERLHLISERQELAEISEAPISLDVARLPLRVVSWGIPLLLAFKIYEWAIVNDGLRDIANNPNIGIVEFFQIILEQTQF